MNQYQSTDQWICIDQLINDCLLSVDLFIYWLIVDQLINDCLLIVDQFIYWLIVDQFILLMAGVFNNLRV